MIGEKRLIEAPCSYCGKTVYLKKYSTKKKYFCRECASWAREVFRLIKKKRK